MGLRVSLADMIRAGSRAVGRYTGTLLAVFVVQALVAAACMVAVWAVLAHAFAHLPLWDEGVDGDLVALLACLRYGASSLYACAELVAGAVLLWALVSWFVVGGLLGVLADRPDGRGETARCFGASGAATYLGYARLALCALPGWILVAFAFLVGMTLALPRIETALTVAEVLGPLALALLPGLALMHVLGTAEAYARVDLTLRHDTHDPGALGTYLRALVFVVRRPLALVHGALGWTAFAAITLAYAAIAHGHAMYGAEGAITLFVIRQGVALARTAIRVGVLGGQLELGRTRPAPARRADAAIEPSGG